MPITHMEARIAKLRPMVTHVYETDSDEPADPPSGGPVSGRDS